MVFCQTGGGGVSEGGKKPNCFFETSIFQRVSRIILGPSKHVLHLVWSAYFISTAVRTALKEARTPQILGENGNYRGHYKSKKRIDFEMGPSVKFVSPNKGLISKKNWGSIFFVGKMTQPVGGGPRGVSQKTILFLLL